MGRTTERSTPSVSMLRFEIVKCFLMLIIVLQGFKHIFMSPSSVDEEEPRVTKSGNARIHGMTHVTKPSLAYIATQVSQVLVAHPLLLTF